MNHALTLLGWNVCLGIPFALLAWCLCRAPQVRNRPALCHGIWLLVLLKLVTPPLVSVPVLPAATDSNAGHRASFASELDRRNERQAVAAANDQIKGVPASPADSTSIKGNAADADLQRMTSAPMTGAIVTRAPAELSWQTIFVGCLAASLLVTLAFWLAAIRQLRRVRRLLRSRAENSDRVSQLLHDISRRFQFKVAPKLFVVDAAVAPLVWAEPGRAFVILSRQLVAALDDDQLRYVIAHELAHYARRDHWSSVFGFFVATLFWWHPVAWFARRELNLAAESCCDALVLEQFAGSKTPYAQTLLTVVDFVSSGNLLRPVLAMTFGGSSSLRRRFQMLANSEVKSKVSFGGWWLLAIGALTLTLLPARAQETRPPSQTKPSAATKKPSAGDSRSTSDSIAKETQPEAEAGKFFVVGSVFDEVTREPIAEASLRFVVRGEQDPDKRVRQTATDDKGRFRLEVAVGNVQLWFPEIKSGYWVDPTIATTALATSLEKPVATLDIPAKRGPAWPVRVTVENGVPENARLGVSVNEVEDDSARTKWLNGEPVSFMVALNSSRTSLDGTGHGAFTQCGKSGKLLVGVDARGDSLEVKGLFVEFLVDPAFDVAKVKTATPIAGTDKVEIIDENGAKAVISKAEVTVTNGRPLLTFHLLRTKFKFQEFFGRIVDAAGKPIHDVRIGTAIGEADAGSGEWPGVVNTDRDGQFRLQVRLLESGRDLQLSLIVNKEGYAAFDSREVPLPKEPVAAIDLGKFTMKAGHSLPIRVVDTSDKPVAGAVVEPGNEYALRRLAIRTDTQGRGVLRNLPAGIVRVTISHADQDQYNSRQLVVSPNAAENTETKLQLKAPATPSDAVTAKPPEPIAVGSTAPELVIETWTDGKQRKLAEFRGRVVVLDFWGTWCGGCITGIPAMRELADKYEPRGVVFLAIHTADGVLDQINKLKKVKAWKTVTGIDRGTTINDGASCQRYGVHGFPSFIVIDGEGKIAYNSGIQPKDIDEAMQDMQKLAESLKIPWPLADEPDEQAISQMNKLIVAMHGRAIEKAIAAGRK